MEAPQADHLLHIEGLQEAGSMEPLPHLVVTQPLFLLGRIVIPHAVKEAAVRREAEFAEPPPPPAASAREARVSGEYEEEVDLDGDDGDALATELGHGDASGSGGEDAAPNVTDEDAQDERMLQSTTEPTVKPSYGSPMIPLVEWSGWLVKEGKQRPSWRKRWFILLQGVLMYFRKQADEREFEPVGWMCVRGFKSEMRGDTSLTLQVPYSMTGPIMYTNRRLRLRCRDSAQRAALLYACTQAAQKPSWGSMRLKGQLYKRGAKNKVWRARHHICIGWNVYYFSSEPDDNGSTSKGSFSLVDVTHADVHSFDSVHNHPNQFMLELKSEDHPRYFWCAHRDAMMTWLRLAWFVEAYVCPREDLEDVDPRERRRALRNMSKAKGADGTTNSFVHNPGMGEYLTSFGQ